MDYNERFGQIEALLADLLRRMDRQAEKMDRQSEQIDSIIGILKLSDERQTRAEERQDAMLADMKQGFADMDGRFNQHNQRIIDQNQRLVEQNQRLVEQGQRLVEQGQRLDATLNTQLKMLELMSRQATKTDELAERMPAIAAYESRVRRLEEAVFNKAS